MRYKIWFGHLYSTAYSIIELIKNNNEGYEFEIFCTNNNQDSVLFEIADHYELEPIIEDDEEYIKYCLDFCLKNKIEVFIPNYKKLLVLAKNVSRFLAQGTKVLLTDNYELMDTLVDKVNSYESFKKHNICATPDYFIANNAEEFKLAYEKLSDLGHQVCFKPRHSIGGMGFRVISEKAESFTALGGYINANIMFEQAYKILSKVDYFDDLIVSEFLEGSEYSIDTLSDSNKLYAIIPRRKINKKARILEEKKDLIEIVKKFHEVYKFPYICNIQIKYHNDIPKLLEINPRMSGGLHISCLSGINIPFEAIKILLEKPIGELNPKYEIIMTQIEKELILKNSFF